ncbi:hypothetical protein RIF25_00110 [Thermosynechococcaceae cyanobacterium BACA0444]|uniref:Uncharacterized protein n=1 Tax=Pseudocalidococcus azoricus BACA0444 TaxID=2918990 RepID=A0AAE4JXV8_9CYAN|nr:hypothetical protein [Pseudocalidococcus azoricus]MDS3859197.1 hypothetical protein [Pseudocalidococcus azoricus BACA0444]
MFFVLGNSLIWGIAGLYLLLSPARYTSKLSLILPGSTPGVSVSLPNIGQASTVPTSPFNNVQVDPRANYKYILMGNQVIDAAAKSQNLTSQSFGVPRIKLLDTTSIIEVELSGNTPVEAQEKAWALYNQFTQELNTLRSKVIAQQDVGIQGLLKTARTRLEIAQKNLSNYKSKSGLSSEDQLNSLSTNIEELRRLRSEAIGERQKAANQQAQLSKTLGLSPQQANFAYVLQADQRFQDNLRDYSQSSAQLAVLLGKWGPNHPVVATQMSKQKQARQALIQRSIALLGFPISPDQVARINISQTAPGAGREALFTKLITLQAEQQGLTAQAEGMSQQILQLEQRLRLLAQKQAVLESYQREVQIAQAVFSSTLAQNDLGQSNIFANYPQVQILTPPILPQEPSSPNPKLALLGAVCSSLLLIAGLTLYWFKIKKNTTMTSAQATQ